MVFSLLWVMQDFYHQPQGLGFRVIGFAISDLSKCLGQRQLRRMFQAGQEAFGFSDLD